MPVCWHERHSRHLTPCRLHHDDGAILAGRTQSGKRWFWAASDPDTETIEHGYTDTEADAIAAYQAAGNRIAGTRDMFGAIYARWASEQRKRVNAAKRAARPAPDTSDAAPVEHLYFVWRREGLHGRTEHHIGTARITKKTAKRIYFTYETGVAKHKTEDVRYLDRSALERDGEVRLSGGWWEDEKHLYATREAAQAVIDSCAGTTEPPADLRALRRAAADAHPDRGGSSDEFRAAHSRYLAAKQHATT